MQNLGLALEDLTGHRLANGTGTADHQKTAFRNDARKLRLVLRDVGGEKRFVPADQFKNVHSLSSNFRHGNAGRDVHNPIFQPQGVLESVVLAMLEHFEFSHHSPDRAGHQSPVVCVLEETVAFLAAVQNDGIEPVIRRGAVRLGDERDTLLRKEPRVSLRKVTFDLHKPIQLLKLSTAQRSIQIG